MNEPSTTDSTPIEACTTFKTYDGKFFASQEEAQRHVAGLRYVSRAKAYTDSRQMTSANATRAQNVICDFLAWEELLED